MDPPSVPLRSTGTVNILVVDDSPQNRTALRAVLSAPEYRLVEAGSGPEALRRLLEEEFALLLIDVVMPGMNGFELATAIKERERTAAVPIVFLTGQAADLEQVYRGYRSGAVDYLVKPLVPEMVRAKVAVFADLYRQRRALLQAERRESDLRLLELRLSAERRQRMLAEAVPHIIFTARADGTVDYFNQRWFEYTGISAEEAAGSWTRAVHPEDLPACREAWESATRSGQVYQAECRLRRGSDGAFRWHLGRAVPERSSAGQVVSWIGTFTDVEAQKDAIRARDEFLSVASHELRTPLTTLQLQLGSLLRPPRRTPGDAPSGEQTRAKLEMAYRQTVRLTRLIDELMDVSRIRAGRLQLDLQETDLSAVAHDVVARLGEDAARAQSHVELRAAGPVIGKWDRGRVEQVLTNLLTNAFKFGGGKPVEITIEQIGPVGRLTVADHGIGIAPEDKERIFHRYEQAISSRSHGGLGLGLYITRQIVDAHAGAIRVESQLGGGSVFTVDLPREPAPTKNQRAGADREQHQPRLGDAHPHH